MNPLLVVGTPCDLHLEVVFNADDGQYGKFYVEKSVVWPGMPMIGHRYVEEVNQRGDPLRPSLFTVTDIAFDGTDGALPILRVTLAAIDAAKYIRELNDQPSARRLKRPALKLTCIECIQDFVDDGWRLPEPLLWWQEGGGEPEKIDFTADGDIDTDEDDENEEDEFADET